MRFLFQIALLIVFTQATFAQSDFLVSMKSSFTHKPKLDARFDTRNSFITNLKVRIMGVKLGLDFNSQTKVGLSYNWLASDFKQTFTTDSMRQLGDLTLWYFSPYFEYNFYKSNKWEISTLMSIGNGRSRVVNDEFKTKYRRFWLYEPYMLGQYNILNWLGLSFGFGYRVTLSGHKNLPSNFSSPIYILKVKIILSQIVGIPE
jgi:hypothetical protein